MSRGARRAASGRELYVGLMSGTSLDGIDAVLADLAHGQPRVVASAHHPFETGFAQRLLELCTPGEGELERAATLGNELAQRYARSVGEVLAAARVAPRSVQAIGCHGQTVRHRPEHGYTIQIGNPALLAELSGIRVVADFRSRDLAAGGQGAPLVPAFHAAVFASARENRAVLNLGGIANLTWLPKRGTVLGFDCGPGNCLLDYWAAHHLGTAIDENGAWGAGGDVAGALLERLLAEPYFAKSPPKSTGRELFGAEWLAARLRPDNAPRNVQATLLELTARAAEQACRRHCGTPARVLVCGGGTRNGALMARLRACFAPAPVETTAQHGIDPSLVEALAFAWLAKQCVDGAAGNLPAATGACGARVLGAVYPGRPPRTARRKTSSPRND